MTNKNQNLYSFLNKFKLIEAELRKNNIKKANNMYTSIALKKKNGEYRIISVPEKKLKEIQKLISSIFERAILVQDRKNSRYLLCDGKYYSFGFGNSSFGFEKGKDILLNAKQHSNHKYFFKTDISKFFDSFDIGMIRKTVNTAFSINYESITKRMENKNKKKSKYYKSLYYNALDLFQYNGRNFKREKYITALLCHNGKLATGSPASPFVANLYMRPFDLKINIWLKNLEIKTGNEYIYTRYADDICISSNAPIPKKVINYIQHTLKEFKLKMNEEKTVLQTNKAKNVITGINVTPEGALTVGRKKKEEIKSMLYHYIVLQDNKYSMNQVFGNYKYLKHIEPEYAKKIWKKYQNMRP